MFNVIICEIVNELLKFEQFEVVVTYNVHRAINEELMKILTMMKNMERRNLTIHEPVEISKLFQLIVSGLGKLFDSSIKVCIYINFHLLGIPGTQQKNLFILLLSEVESEYLLQIFKN